MLTNVHFIERAESSRAFFLKHLRGLTPEQVEFKPFPECKNVRETISHLIVDDLAALDSLRNDREPDYEAFTVSETGYEDLLARLGATHRELTSYLRDRFAEAPLDAPANVWGNELPAALAIAHLVSEDYYHAGQVAFIRMASDPTWDYYASIYGP
jgi:uncharacterized damage-inducible protein DinB